MVNRPPAHLCRSQACNRHHHDYVSGVRVSMHSMRSMSTCTYVDVPALVPCRAYAALPVTITVSHRTTHTHARVRTCARTPPSCCPAPWSTPGVTPLTPPRRGVAPNVSESQVLSLVGQAAVDVGRYQVVDASGVLAAVVGQGLVDVAAAEAAVRLLRVDARLDTGPGSAFTPPRFRGHPEAFVSPRSARGTRRGRGRSGRA
jgi:hypothetical protein